MSEKILFTSDLHLTKDLLRITTCLNYLDYIKNYCKKNSIKHVVLGGDLFHQSNSIKQQSFIPFFNKLFELSQEVKLYIFVGNHEMLNTDRDSLLEAFKPFSHFIKDSETINIGGTDYDFLSYSENPEDIPNKGSVLFTHLEVAEFFFNGFQKSEVKTFTKDSFSNYDLVVSGHIHRMQKDKNIVFPGSPYSTCRGEQGNHYFCVVDGIDYELVEYSEAPDYMSITTKELAEVLKSKDYSRFKNKIVDVLIDSKVEKFVQLRSILLTNGAVEVNPVFQKNDENIDLSDKKINRNEGVAPSFVKYIEQTKVEGINNEKLLSCFKKVLENCKE